jgi:hypothetical protein
LPSPLARWPSWMPWIRFQLVTVCHFSEIESKTPFLRTEFSDPTRLFHLCIILLRFVYSSCTQHSPSPSGSSTSPNWLMICHCLAHGCTSCWGTLSPHTLSS